ncbi:hypothetical protein NCS52_00860600 [Fusarium sp. LHS14.1]|nr:hypothetical protein NCS52_00860600 [Fusarium sp. LHS14.1]
MISTFRIRLPRHGKGHMAWPSPAKRNWQHQTFTNKHQFARYSRVGDMGLVDDYHSWQDVDMTGVQIDPAGRLKRYTGSRMLSPARVTKSQQPRKFGLRSSPQRVLNEKDETDQRDIRVLLDYASDAWASRPLREHLTKIDKLEPPRFVCLHGDQMARDQLPIKFHLGVSVFNTRHIDAIQQGRKDIRQAIKSHHYLVHDPIFHPLNSIKFLHGTPEMVTDAQIAEKLQRLCSPPNILVTYGPKREHRALKKMGLDLSRNYVFDISHMAQTMSDMPHSMSLQWVLEKLQIPFKPELLYVAGNDTHFALQAMLMLAALDGEDHPTPRKVPTWVPTFKEIARAKLPDWDPQTHWTTPAWFREQEERFRQRRDIQHRIVKERYQQRKGRREHEELVQENEDKKRHIERLKARAKYLDIVCAAVAKKRPAE